MANINKHNAVSRMTGMPSKGSILASGGDNVPAVMLDGQNNPVAPAAIKEGEIVFSVESVIGAGDGDYDAGAEFLMHLHDEFKRIGAEKLMEQQGSGLGSGAI